MTGMSHRPHVLAGGIYERTSGAAGQRSPATDAVNPSIPCCTRLYELVAQHAQTILAEVRAADPEGRGLPRHVERELAEYLRCGITHVRPPHMDTTCASSANAHAGARAHVGAIRVSDAVPKVDTTILRSQAKVALTRA
jgi:hypothetical protein